MNNASIQHENLIGEIKALIEQRRHQVAVTVNASMSLLYWQIGKRMNDEVLHERRAAYGEKIVALLVRQLATAYGALFTEKNLRRMMQFAAVFPDRAIVVSLIRQLSWTHILAILPIDDPLKRSFYIEMCQLNFFRNLYILRFLNLKKGYSEKDRKSAIAIARNRLTAIDERRSDE